ncbi:hypothetical protein QYE77_02185 [Thermanaerothrix sp. 4228-RoL]|uniref:CBM20 domain-containing protein n=1 Tax=Thermanaerothrix solaris TaxID=3058434 RepID=A0ABU3NJN0_9CHLR|nr:hypothetical protein [Thermanaerothrix sp. 4228-RoL]MDT8897058.1 hypothetical protein [Thermanaerothrix sp. 4228-RoL]
MKSSLFPYTPRAYSLFLFLILFVLAACQNFSLPRSAPTPTTSIPNLPLVPLTFQVNVPTSASSGDVILEIVDEVTGIALNSERYTMQLEGNRYILQLAFPIGSVVCYRYLHQEAVPQVERNPYGQIVRYRMAVARSPAVIEDHVFAWQGGKAPTEEGGTLLGLVYDSTTRAPISDALVTMAGIQTFTTADGTFTLENIPPGKHNLVVLPTEGAYQVFQQEAVIANGAVTPAQIGLQPVPMVNVTFVVQPPSEHIRGLPMRIVGNTPSLGNTFSDLEGGLSVLASRAPLLSLLEDGKYTYTLSLPAGTDLRYKYTLGDGFWNAEHTADGGFKTRQLIVPDHDITITDKIETWRVSASETSPLTFYIKAPPETPADERVSIQFRLYAWTPAIPMWPLGNQQWLYVFYGPQRALGEVNYRVCRNEQCGLADDVTTAGNTATGLSVSSPDGTTITHEVQQWNYLVAQSPISVSTQDATPRSSFVAAVEFAPQFSPTTLPHLPATLQGLRHLGANWVILSPTWSLISGHPPRLNYDPAHDMKGSDLNALVANAKQQGLSVAIFPRLNPYAITQSLQDSPELINAWLSQYLHYITDMAIRSAQSQIHTLILGGPEIEPFLDGQDDFWNELVLTLRQKFSGQLVWAVPENRIASLPDWVTQMDALYILVSSPFEDRNLNEEAITEAFGNYLDTHLLPLYQQTGKPVWLGLEHPSAQDIQNDCVLTAEGCLPFERLIWSGSLPSSAVDLERQARFYQGAAMAINSRPWIRGLVTRGYQPAVTLIDASPSIRGKPAADVIKAWYQIWTNTTSP